MNKDTIAAIATPAGIGGIGIIRVSGECAFSIARQLASELPTSIEFRRLYLSELRTTGADSPAVSTSLDKALVVMMQSPHSYTGEDVVELHCHGGLVHLQSILDVVLYCGARPAAPGEFTRRAFLNGKLDLVQAEAIADLIHAKSEAACRLARHHLAGRLSHELTALQENMAQALTLVEAAIDFSTEQHVYQLDEIELDSTLKTAHGQVATLLKTYDRGRVQRDGIRCVIAGRPNAGKSSLLNRLLNEDRVIVAETPGTTRDYVEAELVLGDNMFTVVDTAGLRDKAHHVETEGVRRSYQQIAQTDLLMYLMDSSKPIEHEERALLAEFNKPGILIWNKCDLTPAGPPPAPPEMWVGPVFTQLSTDNPVEDVFAAMTQASKKAGLTQLHESVALSRARHRDALTRALEGLKNARKACSDGLDIELIALDMRLALDAVGEILGQVTPNDILNRIFADFCVGK